MNLGSKMVLDATTRRVDPVLREARAGGGVVSSARGRGRDQSAGAPIDTERVRAIDSRIIAARALENALLAIKIDSGIAAGGGDAGAQVLERVLASGGGGVGEARRDRLGGRRPRRPHLDALGHLHAVRRRARRALRRVGAS